MTEREYVLRLAGRSWAAIAEELGRSVGSRHQCIRNYGLTTIYGPLAEIYNVRGAA